MLNLNLNNLRRLFGAAAMAAAGLAVSAPAAADSIYSWRTEDGTYAFTDSIKNVPARYRSSAEVRKMSGLSDYERYTPQDQLASTRYEDAVATRLAQFEARQALSNSTAAPIAAVSNVGHTVSLRTGGVNSPSIELNTGGSDTEPMVVETLFTRPADQMATRRSVVVTQGDRTLAIVKPRLRSWNVNDDIHIEGDLGE